MRGVHNLELEAARRHEGLELTAYQDKYGVWTIGFGHTGDVKQGDEITAEQAEELFLADYGEAARLLDVTWPEFEFLHLVQKAVLRNMIFNMGLSRVLKFGNMLASLRRGDSGMAAIDLLDSKYHREDVGKRAVHLAKQLYTKEWQSA